MQDRDSKQPAAREAAAVADLMRENGVLISTDGPYHNVLKVKPPMVITAADADLFVEVLDAALTEASSAASATR